MSDQNKNPKKEGNLEELEIENVVETELNEEEEGASINYKCSVNT
jgi:hypothetical protein